VTHKQSRARTQAAGFKARKNNDEICLQLAKEFVDVKATPEDLAQRAFAFRHGGGALEQTAAGPLLDAELTSNRADCLGHYGIAREAAALYRQALNPWKLTRAKLRICHDGNAC